VFNRGSRPFDTVHFSPTSPVSPRGGRRITQEPLPNISVSLPSPGLGLKLDSARSENEREKSWERFERDLRKWSVDAPAGSVNDAAETRSSFDSGDTNYEIYSPEWKSRKGSQDAMLTSDFLAPLPIHNR
jgi:hypothetical protein